MEEENKTNKRKKWRANNKAKAKARKAAVSAEKASKGQFDPYIAKKMAKRAEKEKRRAAKKFSRSIKMFTAASASYKREAEQETEKNRDEARAVKKEAIVDFQRAQEKLLVASCLQGKPAPTEKNAEAELLKKIYQ